GRFLEHSRIFFFLNGESQPTDGDFFIGSADWMRRNLHARVEVITPVLDRGLKRKCYEILTTAIEDERQAWELQSDGSYKHRSGGPETLGSQEKMMQITSARNQFVSDVQSS